MAAFLGVTKQGYYKWRKRRANPCKDVSLLIHIRDQYEKSEYAYGSPRIYRALRMANIRCGKYRVERLMRMHKIRAISSRKFKIQTTQSAHEFPISDNLLKQDFSANAPNRVWVSDITFIRARNRWLYLCVIVDLYSRKVVGWKVSRQIDTSLVTAALMAAIKTRNPAPGLILHSDRGSQYASAEFRAMLKEHSFVSSMSRKANCYDNACAESIFATLKKERLSHMKFEDIHDAQKEIFKYIELFYNRKRLHSTLNYLSPEEFETQNVA